MKKNILFLLFTILIITSVFFTKRFFSSNKIPRFEYKLLDNSKFTNLDLKNNNLKTIIIYFSTDCEGCSEIFNKTEFIKNCAKKYNLVFVVSESNSLKVKKFVNYSETKKLNIPILLDENNNFASDFALGISINYPTILLFSKNGVYEKEVEDIEQLLIYK